MPGLTCGIDIGSTNVKVVLVDEEGRALHVRAVPTPRVSDGMGPVSDAAALVTTLEEMILAGWREVGRGLPLRAIASAGVGEDGVGVDADLRPTGFALPWFDPRAAREAAALRDGTAATARAGIAMDADRTAAKWLWLRRHRPEDLRAARCWMALTDFPAAWWAGVPFLSATLAPRSGCYDVYARRWIASLLDASGAPPLPGIRTAGTAIGTMRAGPLTEAGAASRDTLLVAGGHDHPVAAEAIRSLAPGARVDSMGTANLVYGEASGPDEPYLDPFMAFSIPPSGAPGLACLGVTGLSDALAPARTDETAFRRAIDGASIPGEPLADRSRAPVRHALERASFHARRMFAAMDRAGAPPGPIFATGGWARSTAFLQLRASVFGQPVQVVDEPELTAIGAARLAAVAASPLGPSTSIKIRTVEPVEAWAAVYDEAFPAVCRDLEAEMGRRDGGPPSAPRRDGTRSTNDEREGQRSA